MSPIRIGGLGLGRSSAQIRNWVVLSTWSSWRPPGKPSSSRRYSAAHGARSGSSTRPASNTADARCTRAGLSSRGRIGTTAARVCAGSACASAVPELASSTSTRAAACSSASPAARRSRSGNSSRTRRTSSSQ